MNYTVSISNFRKDLFNYAKLVMEKGYEVEVEKDGKRIFKITRITDNPKSRAKKALTIAKALGGTWKKPSDSNFFRGSKEVDYMDKLGQA